MLKIITSLLLIGFCQFTFSQDLYPITDNVRQKIDSVYKGLIKKNKVIGASIAIVDKGQIVYATGYGFSDILEDKKADENTIYRIGSISKSFTALSLMQLQQEGKLFINESIKKHLPEFQLKSRYLDSNQFVIADMLSHTAGIPSDFWNGFFCDSPPDQKWVINQLNKTETAHSSQLNFAYSNIAYGVLGELVARKSNQKYEDYLSESIFKPLGMQSSFVYPTLENSKNLSKGYIKGKEFKEPSIRDAAAGLIHSSVLDMSNYLKMFLNNGAFNEKSIVDSALLQEMYKDRLVNTILNSNIKYGFALMLDDYYVATKKDTIPVTIISHGGDTYAFHADFGFIPELNVGVVVLTNSDTGPAMNHATDLLSHYLKFTYSQKLLAPSKVETDFVENRIIKNIANLSEVIGKYNLGITHFEVKNPKKIKFKQGPITLRLKAKDDKLARYSVAIVALGIPIKIPSQEFQFANINGEIYARGVDTKKGILQFMGMKNYAPSAIESWKNKLGTYSAVGDLFDCKDCEIMNLEKANLELTEKDGLIYIEMEGKSSDTKFKLYFDALDETTLSCGGLGRGMTEKVKLLSNGNLFYQGFEFKKD
jgi:CubicO group peptidase (beta-lactamase class C family)